MGVEGQCLKPELEQMEGKKGKRLKLEAAGSNAHGP